MPSTSLPDPATRQRFRRRLLAWLTTAQTTLAAILAVLAYTGRLSLGAVAVLAFLALAVIGFVSDEEAKVRGAYLLMAPAAWFVLVPLAHASLLSGIVLSLVG